MTREKNRKRPRDDFRLGFSERLRDARRRAKLSQETVAGMLGERVTKSTVSQWESATSGTLPTIDKLPILAKAYGVSLDFLFFGDSSAKAAQMSTSAPALSEQAVEIAGAWDLLNDFHKDIYRSLIFYDATLSQKLPTWFKWGRPKSASYSDFEERVRSDAEHHKNQLKLNF